MKMPEKHDLLAAILAAKGTEHPGQSLAFAMAAFMNIMAVRFTKQ